MKDAKIVTLRQPGEVTDPLTAALRNGTHQLLAQAIEAELTNAWQATLISQSSTAVSVLSGTATCRNGRSRPASGRSRTRRTRSFKSGLAGGLQTLEEAHSFGAPLCLYLGGRRLSSGAWSQTSNAFLS